MRTVPKPELSPPEPFTWNVRKDRFPFGVGDVIGTVQAHFKPTALSLAQQEFGKHVVVERVLRIAEIAQLALDGGR